MHSRPLELTLLSLQLSPSDLGRLVFLQLKPPRQHRMHRMLQHKCDGDGICVLFVDMLVVRQARCWSRRRGHRRHIQINPQESRGSRPIVREAVAHCVMHDEKWGSTTSDPSCNKSGVRLCSRACPRAAPAARGMPPQPAGQGVGFIDGKLQESCPFSQEEAAVYAALPRLMPAGAFHRADFVLRLSALRGYHKEKPRTETTASELARILEWRDKNGMDEVRLWRSFWRSAYQRVGVYVRHTKLLSGAHAAVLLVGQVTRPCGVPGALRAALTSRMSGRACECTRGGDGCSLSAAVSGVPAHNQNLRTPRLLAPPLAVPAPHTRPGGRVPPLLAHASPRRGRLRTLRGPGAHRGAPAHTVMPSLKARRRSHTHTHTHTRWLRRWCRILRPMSCPSDCRASSCWSTGRSCLRRSTLRRCWSVAAGEHLYTSTSASST